MRFQHPRDPSGSALAARQYLSHLGVQLERLVAGRPAVRGHSGYPFRWGEGWFEEIRDGGPGWNFQKHAESAIDFRTNLLLDIYRPRHSSGLPALMDLMHAGISGVLNAPT